jgi:hypothetical protein
MASESACTLLTGHQRGSGAVTILPDEVPEHINGVIAVALKLLEM